MQHLSCPECGTRVLVKKNSPAQTTVQWTGAAAADCPQFAAQVGRSGSTAHIRVCPSLRAGIEAQVRAGLLAVGDE